jgi:hypothetical protein
MEVGSSQDGDGALITEQIIEELRQDREREEMEEREWDSKDLNASFVDLLLTIEEDVPSGAAARYLVFLPPRFLFSYFSFLDLNQKF